MNDWLFIGVLALFAVNGWTVLRFWQDKQWAIAGERRIPEADLLMLAAIGGMPGALIARHVFRHKTRKQPFTNHLQVIAMLQSGVGLGLLIAFW